MIMLVFIVFRFLGLFNLVEHGNFDGIVPLEGSLVALLVLEIVLAVEALGIVVVLRMSMTLFPRPSSNFQ